MRHITQEGIDLIKRFEGFSSTVYICPAGYPTIGYGHLVRDHEKFEEISQEEAEALLRIDVESAERAVLRLIKVPLTDGQFDALVSFTYNLGSGALQCSTLRRKVNRQAHSEVPGQLIRWVWAGGRKLNGLARRRRAEAISYRSVGIELVTA
ncbi:MAG: lysozyme [Chloroflexi bacterium]|nr:lysozyme [Chloroflexota bacterium]